MQVVCAPCGLKYKTQKIGVLGEEFMDKEKKQPYRIWGADVLVCSGCGHTILANFAQKAIIEHFEPEYQDYQKRNKERIYPFY